MLAETAEATCRALPDAACLCRIVVDEFVLLYGRPLTEPHAIALGWESEERPGKIRRQNRHWQSSAMRVCASAHTLIALVSSCMRMQIVCSIRAKNADRGTVCDPQPAYVKKAFKEERV